MISSLLLKDIMASVHHMYDGLQTKLNWWLGDGSWYITDEYR